LEEAGQILHRTLAANPDDLDLNYNAACYYSIKDDVTLAIEYLAKAIRLGPGYRKTARNDSDFDKIRHDMRFIELVSDTPPYS
jgi:adenylate cyclase